MNNFTFILNVVPDPLLPYSTPPVCWLFFCLFLVFFLPLNFDFSLLFLVSMCLYLVWYNVTNWIA